MSATEKELVQRTWKELVPVADAVAELFHRKLFDVDPEIIPLFKGDMGDMEQGRKLTDMITVAVYGLDIMEPIIPAVQELAARHAGNGVSASHYDTVGGALLWTLEQGLGAAFTPEVREAWAGMYELLATTMENAGKNAGKSARKEPPVRRDSSCPPLVRSNDADTDDRTVSSGRGGRGPGSTRKPQPVKRTGPRPLVPCRC